MKPDISLGTHGFRKTTMMKSYEIQRDYPNSSISPTRKNALPMTPQCFQLLAICFILSSLRLAFWLHHDLLNHQPSPPSANWLGMLCLGLALPRSSPTSEVSEPKAFVLEGLAPFITNHRTSRKMSKAYAKTSYMLMPPYSCIFFLCFLCFESC